MRKLLPTKHLLLVAAVSTAILVGLIVLPEEKKQQTFISLDATLDIVEPSTLTVTDLQLPHNRSYENNIVTQTKQSEDSNLAIEGATFAKTTLPPSFLETSVKIKSGDSLSRILSKAGISAQDIYKVSLADKEQGSLLRIRPGQTLNFTVNNTSGELTQLTYIKNRISSVVFERDTNSFNRTNVEKEPNIVQTYKEADINSSLFIDGLKSGISQALLIELANIFGWDIDFALDIRKGDSLSVLYEEKYLEGEKIGNGNILAAQFINNGRTFQAIRFDTKKGANYYTPDGLAMRKAFIRTPVDFTRISSKFNPNRLHPIFKTSRPHRGVDYAAASGTPVKAAGDGKITFAGKQNGYGNVVIIDHGKGYETLYAHLRGFARGTKRGARIQQGETVAYVGQTGWATGPHLHYEFRVNGVHKNPVTVKLPNDDPMPKKDLENYLPYARQITATLSNSHSPDFAQKLALLKK
ncbi:peptidoglycan DD-metalloendopeptidase family protein [Marinomonas algarum]|uniref:Peptidoglycan DD-metalloendopeptidase family protein n=1 Tax=Marinomonas algarum TaxID=2883105 RepID=A0A9X1IRD1_9GAMM|nr:peptidoglycan DD-metalloendopeptidase family protein [Marinomonas algarum]MCB5162916.1 peptidoglycan DD-metalloendopeptidase family protein [Marinomonas algarum]